MTKLLALTLSLTGSAMSMSVSAAPPLAGGTTPAGDNAAHVTLRTTPAPAAIYIEGEFVGHTPESVALNEHDDIRVELRAPEFQPAVLFVSADDAGSIVTVRLRPGSSTPKPAANHQDIPNPTLSYLRTNHNKENSNE